MKCVLVGCGYWGSILRRYVEENEFFELVCVADSKTDLNVVWGNREVEAVVVATPIETHYSIVKAALLAGKHVFCEKPLALKVEECNELKKISKSCGLVLHTDYVFTFSRGLRFIQEVIGAAEVGELLACELNVKHLGRFGRQDVFWLLGSHMLSVLDMFCPLKLLDFCFVEFVKNETGAIFFDGKVKGVINVSLNFPFKEVKVVFYCQNATLVYDSVASESVKKVVYEKPCWTVASKIPKKVSGCGFDESNNLRFAFESFRDCILGKEKSNVDLAVDITEILEKR